MATHLAETLIEAIMEDVLLLEQYTETRVREGASVQFATYNIKADMRAALEALSEQDTVKMIAALNVLKGHA